MSAKSRKTAKSPAKRTAETDKSPKRARRAGATVRATATVGTSKQQRCLDLLARRDGATLAELMAATEWLPHSVRGFLSGTVKKKLSLSLNSWRDADGTRRYAVERPTRGQ